MTCYRSRDNWHSYVKNSLSEAELKEMTSHLAHCPECRDVVSVIQETFNGFAKARVNFHPPTAIKFNVMMAIDKNLYLETFPRANSSHLFAVRNWGFSMIAAGILLFALNLTSLSPNLEDSRMNELHIELNKQVSVPLDKMSQITNDALVKLESLSLLKHK